MVDNNVGRGSGEQTLSEAQRRDFEALSGIVAAGFTLAPEQSARLLELVQLLQPEESQG